MNHAVEGGEEPHALSRLRRYLVATLLVGVVGLAFELLLIGHFDEWPQRVPIVLLPLGFGALAWRAIAGTPASVAVVRGLMAAFVLSGVIGIGLHYRGNEEFELEMYPSLSGFELAWQTLTGATPVLAPGSMALIGLVGLGATYGYPALGRPVADTALEEETRR
jgi:hypothetical protein